MIGTQRTTVVVKSTGWLLKVLYLQYI